MGYIAGIGGANMDIHGKSDRQLIMRDSNPGSLHTSLGGVCRNICENLARLGETVRLITVVGDDVQGRGIIEGCEKAGIDMSATRVLRGERSSSYISIMDGDGDMLLAMSDMHIIKQLNAQLVDESRDLLCGADLVVCDGNLSVRTSSGCLRSATGRCIWIPFPRHGRGNSSRISAALTRLSPTAWSWKCSATARWIRLKMSKWLATSSEARACGACSFRLAKTACITKGREGGIWGQSRAFDGMVNATGAGDASMAGHHLRHPSGLYSRRCPRVRHGRGHGCHFFKRHHQPRDVSRGD